MIDQFVKAMKTLGAIEPDAVAAFQVLATKYTEAGRVYHTLGHIQTVLTIFDDIFADVVPGGEAAQPELYATAVAGIWYHDAVYNKSPSDVQDSVALFRQTWTGRLPSHVVFEVMALIDATDYTTSPSHTRLSRLSQLVRAADLAAGLAGSYERFLANAHAVALEYGLDDTSREYKEQRLSVLLPLVFEIDADDFSNTIEDARTEALMNVLRYEETVSGPVVPEDA